MNNFILLVRDKISIEEDDRIQAWCDSDDRVFKHIYSSLNNYILVTIKDSVDVLEFKLKFGHRIVNYKSYAAGN